MELWLESSRLYNFADDTTTGCKGIEALRIKRNLEKDAKNVLEFMVSNGLVANQSKTEFLVLNERDKTSTELREIKVGDTTYPICLDPYKPITINSSRMLRQQENRIFADSCRLNKSETSFHIDAASTRFYQEGTKFEPG